MKENPLDDLFSEFFATTRAVPVTSANLANVADDLANHFRVQEYTVSEAPLPGGGWFVSLRKGDGFRALLGMKTALNVRLEPGIDAVSVRASIGIFELQLIPTIITAFVFTPVILGQIWGIIQQNQLDEEAVRVVEESLYRRGMQATAAASPGYTGTTGPMTVDTPHDPARAQAERELGDPAI